VRESAREYECVCKRAGSADGPDLGRICARFRSQDDTSAQIPMHPGAWTACPRKRGCLPNKPGTSRPRPGADSADKGAASHGSLRKATVTKKVFFATPPPHGSPRKNPAGRDSTQHNEKSMNRPLCAKRADRVCLRKHFVQVWGVLGGYCHFSRERGTVETGSTAALFMRPLRPEPRDRNRSSPTQADSAFLLRDAEYILPHP
jgi:hypothetical protein